MDATFADEICHANYHSRSSTNTTRANDSSNSCGHQKETLGMQDTPDLAQPRQHKKQALEITHHREVAPSPTSTIPEDIQDDERARNYTKDFEDFASGDETKQTAVECHYATINKKRNKPFNQPLGNQLMAKPTAGVHWKFDGNPLASIVMKKLEAAESKDNVKAEN